MSENCIYVSIRRKSMQIHTEQWLQVFSVTMHLFTKYFSVWKALSCILSHWCIKQTLGHSRMSVVHCVTNIPASQLKLSWRWWPPWSHSWEALKLRLEPKASDSYSPPKLPSFFYSNAWLPSASKGKFAVNNTYAEGHQKVTWMETSLLSCAGTPFCNVTGLTLPSFSSQFRGYLLEKTFVTLPSK